MRSLIVVIALPLFFASSFSTEQIEAQERTTQQNINITGEIDTCKTKHLHDNELEVRILELEKLSNETFQLVRTLEKTMLVEIAKFNEAADSLNHQIHKFNTTNRKIAEINNHSPLDKVSLDSLYKANFGTIFNVVRFRNPVHDAREKLLRTFLTMGDEATELKTKRAVFLDFVESNNSPTTYKILVENKATLDSMTGIMNKISGIYNNHILLGNTMVQKNPEYKKYYKKTDELLYHSMVYSKDMKIASLEKTSEYILSPIEMRF